MKHEMKWFIDHIGKRIHRDKGTCDCGSCSDTKKHGLIVGDKFHAEYLYDVQCEMDIEYYE